ncbi:hypothetical protein P167DRAFT_567456 [Morchella conica CCBAS932]|uniref:Uncharacterized protein n=1 Tax=Morchella conica CCBAS932 TaxID=1392247 RepID=A0A3N4KL69_9PEZI|nr:hypothetical protein P167DRAFT_567456 [Morchella conica CCBAS932]
MPKSIENTTVFLPMQTTGHTATVPDMIPEELTPTYKRVRVQNASFFAALTRFNSDTTALWPGFTSLRAHIYPIDHFYARNLKHLLETTIDRRTASTQSITKLGTTLIHFPAASSKPRSLPASPKPASSKPTSSISKPKQMAWGVCLQDVLKVKSA